MASPTEITTNTKSANDDLKFHAPLLQPAVVVTTLNLLNPSYAVKWGTREGCVVECDKPQSSQTNSHLQSNWHLGRKEQVLNILRDSRFDIACLQEVSAQVLVELQMEGSLCTTGLALHRNLIDGVTIAYNPLRLHLLRQLVVNHHDRHQYPPAPLARSFVIADFGDLLGAGGNIYRVASIHLKGYDISESRQKQREDSKVTGCLELESVIQVLRDLSQTDPPHHSVTQIIAGDFNEDANELERWGIVWSRHLCMANQGFQSDSKLVTLPSEHQTQRKIDWIYARKGYKQKGGDPVFLPLTPQQNKLLTTVVSDHALVLSNIAVTATTTTTTGSCC